MPSNQGIEPRSPALQADSLLSEPPGKTLMSWLQIKKILLFWNVIFSYSVQQQVTISWLHFGLPWKVDFIRLTNDGRLSSWTEKKLQNTCQSQTCTKKRSWPLSGGLLPVWLTAPVMDLLESEYWQNHYIWEVWSASGWDALKTAAGTG